MITINESGNFDVTDNYPLVIDTITEEQAEYNDYASEQELYEAKLAELHRIIQSDRRA